MGTGGIFKGKLPFPARGPAQWGLIGPKASYPDPSVWRLHRSGALNVTSFNVEILPLLGGSSPHVPARREYLALRQACALALDPQDLRQSIEIPHLPVPSGQVPGSRLRVTGG